MKIVKTLIMLLFIGLSTIALRADEYDDYMRKINEDLDAFKEKTTRELDEFRDQMNREYAEFLAKPWVYKPISPPVVRPKEDPVPPLIIPEEDRKKPIDDNPIDIPIVPAPTPSPTPAPTPPAPIPVPTPQPLISKVEITLYGTKFSIPCHENLTVPLYGVDHNSIGKCWMDLNNDKEIDRTILGLMECRKNSRLPDWAFYRLVSSFADTKFRNRNQARMFVCFALSQCGYDVRLADANNNLYVMVACNEYIIDVGYFTVDGSKYYIFEKTPERIHFVDGSFPRTSPMRLQNIALPLLSSNPGKTRTITPVHYKDINLKYTPDLNLMAFFEDYPVSSVTDSPINPWANYAMTPLSPNMKKDIYPILKRAIAGKSQRDAANIIIDFVESFTYGYDDEIWGHDRAFFPEETLHYPYSDCEDHAILFVRLINDLLGLPTALIHYPGHLAAAVSFTEPVEGSYIIVNNKKFTVCDPTIYYAGIGTTMRGMDNSTARLLVMPKF